MDERIKIVCDFSGFKVSHNEACLKSMKKSFGAQSLVFSDLESFVLIHRTGVEFRICGEKINPEHQFSDTWP
jgi:hypothetical protein